ncbi:hypothetical protein AQI88_40275 [Streptomyces cellostaticus]|uniref:Uncharacterized protein n=1 Tax=Streptomyces cellostaticus TaxID=67285 RepID=A0A101N7L8_9ACTN|nr:hypothetical protein AQI88_40275 [Streptomyces cellostaticus]GHI07971.1 hypothetical protein Scel_62920 [Streptomyces cellostaticus]
MTGRLRALAWSGVVAGAAVAAGLIAVAVFGDLNTAGQLAGIAGAIISLLGLGASMYALVSYPPTQTDARSMTRATGSRSVAAGGSIGSAVTGDQAHGALAGAGAAPLPQPPSPTSSGRTVQASGHRAVAAGGDIGNAITGDVSTEPGTS